jgi:hypothetical protein
LTLRLKFLVIYGSIADLNDSWYTASTNAVALDGAGRFGSVSLRIKANNYDWLGTVASSYQSIVFGESRKDKEVIFGCAMKVAGNVTDNHALLIPASSPYGTKWQCYVQLRTDMSLRVIGGGGANLGSSPANTIVSGAWHFIEFKFLVHDSAGYFEVKIDEDTVISNSGVDTQNQGASDVIVMGMGAQQAANWYLTDVYIADDTGPDNNDFLGDCRVDTVRPTGAGALSQWTPSGEATNWECVNDTTPNDDTDYVTTSVSGEKDTYTFDNLASVNAQVFGVQMTGYGRRIRKLQMLPRIEGVEYGSGELLLYPDYNFHHTIFELNPATGLEWEQEEINSGEFGYAIIF